MNGLSLTKNLKDKEHVRKSARFRIKSGRALTTTACRFGGYYTGKNKGSKLQNAYRTPFWFEQARARARVRQTSKRALVEREGGCVGQFDKIMWLVREQFAQAIEKR